MRRAVLTHGESQYLSSQQFHAALPVPTAIQFYYIQRLAAGDRVAEIAASRGVSASAVRCTLKRLYRRYRVRSSAHLVATAVRAGWLTLGAARPGIKKPTGKQRLTMLLLASGYSLAEIAERRGVMHWSLHYQLKHLFRRLGVRRQSALVAVALRQGWIR